MVDRSQIRPHMDVIASDGERVGKVDAVEGERIKLTKDASGDGKHHHVDLVRRRARRRPCPSVEDPRRAGPAAAAGAAAGPGRRSRPIPLPPIRNPTVDGATPRRNYMLPWVLAGLALLA